MGGTILCGQAVIGKLPLPSASEHAGTPASTSTSVVEIDAVQRRELLAPGETGPNGVGTCGVLPVVRACLCWICIICAPRWVKV